MTSWADSLPVHTVLYDPVEGSIAVKTGVDKWVESNPYIGKAMDDDDVLRLYSSDNLVYRGNYALDIVKRLPVESILRTPWGAVYKEGDDTWLATRTSSVYTDEEIAEIEGLELKEPSV